MKCITRRHRPSPVPSEKAKTEAVQRELERVRGQWPTVLRGVAEVLAHHERNHIAENIITAIRGDSP